MEQKITCLLVDDENASRVVLRELIHRFCTQVEILGEATHVEEAEIKILDLKPDLVFLDIQMPGKDGFDLLKRFPNKSFHVIFVTSFDQFAIKAFKVNAQDYLLKPIDIDDLIQAIQKIETLIYASNARATDLAQKLTFHAADKVFIVDLNEIEYFEAVSNYTKAFLKNGNVLIQSKNLSEIEEMLERNALFFRIHKSVMVNKNCIQAYSKTNPSYITLQSGKIFEISRRKKTELLQKLSLLPIRSDV